MFKVFVLSKIVHNFSQGLMGLRPREVERRNRIKARLLEDGPRPRQKSVLAILWTGIDQNQNNTVCHLLVYFSPPAGLILPIYWSSDYCTCWSSSTQLLV
jgi:hypothetical protein